MGAESEKASESTVEEHGEARRTKTSHSSLDAAEGGVVAEEQEQLRKVRTDQSRRSGYDLEKLQSHRSHHSVIETTFLQPVTDMSRGWIGWDGEDDPENPRNWSRKRRFSLLLLVSSMTFTSPLASSMAAPAVTFIDKQFHNTNEVLTSFVISVYVLGWAFGPLVLSPLSEIYGRKRVLDAANFFFVVWQLACALAPNFAALIIFRFLGGLGGAACLTIGGGVISDLFPPDERGFATAMYTLGPLIGPVAGPIAGGFLAQEEGWRWVFWLLLILSGFVTVMMFFANRETNPHILIARKTEKLRKETGNNSLVSWYIKDKKPQTQREILKHGLLTPMKMFKSPIVVLMCAYMCTVYGILYLLFTTITLVYQEQYGWSPNITGLAYIGIGCGFLIGIGLTARFLDATLVRLAARNHGVLEPEMRLPACTAFSILIPIGLFWYGWSADKHAHWIVPLIGLAPFGIGMMGIFVPIQTYMIDAFPEYAASALATLTASRSIFGALLPLAGNPMYSALGLGWGNSLLGFIAIGLTAPIFFIYKYGARIRKNHPLDLS